jgi:hypothetical protein
MEARILKQDGTLGKKIYTIDVPYDMDPIQKRLNKTLLGAGRWRNSNASFFTILAEDGFTPYFSEEVLKEIIAWMGKVKEED